MQCPSSKCGSTNVQDLPHYWQGLPSDSPLKQRYAQPAAVDGRGLFVLGAVTVGIVVMVAGGILLGLLILAVGVVAGVVSYQQGAAAGLAREAWERSLICLACTGTFTR